MIINGREIAKKINERTAQGVSDLGFTPNVALVQVGSHPAIDSFVSIKKKLARRVGVVLSEFVLPENVTTADVLAEIELIVRSENSSGKKKYQGLIVQLPLPGEVKVDEVLSKIPRHLDIDVLSPEGERYMYQDGVLPPVVGAVREVLRALRVNLKEKKVAVIGAGRLVGAPVIEWLKHQKIDTDVVTLKEGSLEDSLNKASIVITGTGNPKMIRPDMVNRKHILIDAGTSESQGVLVGDVDPNCVNICQAITPVPGGIGPITVAVLFQNLLTRLQSTYDKGVE